MRDAAPNTIYLKDYTPFGWLIDEVQLRFHLSPGATRVVSRIAFRPNPDAPKQDFFLHGEQLTLIKAMIDGKEVPFEVTDTGLTGQVPSGDFIFEAEVEIAPDANTALEGLYMSNGMYCTQCEAEGFRKITYYPDRPDVMATFHVRIEGHERVLLSNGNPGDAGEGYAEWHDPWPKPAYLFALVAGDLVNHPDRFTTSSGKDVELNIWVRPGDEHKCAFGLEALKKSMTWDEEVYGREYDLDIFNIVAVDDFNMGAMENKGLNIFNSSCVLASPDTSTDGNFERIESIIAHEYFHNWTGNRITCRDWFQLCLKEGLTVFRDQQFTSDMRSEPVKRIHDVASLRARQFPEDQGPLSHPVRPDQFQEINNFYTATVYEKGAEVIGMLKTIVGDAGYAKAVELYFQRHDGDAATIEDWLKVFEDATGRDLSQFKRWYSQSGTPRLHATDSFEDGTYTLTFRQTTPATQTQPDTAPQVLPIAVGLLGPNGDEVQPTTVLEMTEETQSFSFDGLSARPTPSILRGFSAPVVLEQDITHDAFLLAHDTDPFNRWEAGRMLARTNLMDMATSDASPNAAYLDGLQSVVRDISLDPAFRALMLGQPSQSELAAALHEDGTTPDPARIHIASETMRQAKADAFATDLPVLLEETRVSGPYSPEAGPASKRALGMAALRLMTRLDGGAAAKAQYDSADNMTLQLGALECLIEAGQGKAALAAFYDQWKHDVLVIDKWFGLQVMLAKPDAVATTTHLLTEHSDFNWKNPNRFRSVFGMLAANHAGFHHESGDAYRLLTDWLIRLDPINPQTAARMCAAFQTWRRYDKPRRELIRAQLERIAGRENLSRDTGEMVGRILGG